MTKRKNSSRKKSSKRSKTRKISSRKKKKSSVLKFPKVNFTRQFQFEMDNNKLTSEEYYVLSEIFDHKNGKAKSVWSWLRSFLRGLKVSNSVRADLNYIEQCPFHDTQNWPFDMNVKEISSKIEFLQFMNDTKDLDYFERNPKLKMEIIKILTEDGFM